MRGTATDEATSQSFDSIEAARSSWQADQPPTTGWVAVSLPDVWTSRWSAFDGVVWYRLTWHQAQADKAQAIMLDYLNMAGAAYLNGSLLSRDDHLVEPLTRAWNTPRYWVVDAPLLRAGTNILLIRISGLSAYQPGLGEVVRGEPAAVQALYDEARWIRHDLQLFSLAITVTLGGFFLTLWLIRRAETAYGWFSAMSLAWWCYAFNQVATRTWPFASTDAWEKATSIAFIVYCGCFTMFVLRFCGRHAPRTERALWAIFAVGGVWLILTPKSMIGEVRALWALIPVLSFIASCVLLLYLSWRNRQIEQRIMSVCMVIFLVTGIHDLLVFWGVLHTNIYYTAPTSQVLMISMALVLAWRFADNIRRIEHFNDELRTKVDTAKQELAHTLQRQYELEVVNARLGERLSLAHDLHDGLGGTLVSSIAALEHSPQGIPAERFLQILKELRDDLRIVIDTASTRQGEAASLVEQIAPLRHRLTRLFESQRIECEWHLPEIEYCRLSAAQSLDVMRILQEALTNVLKHSQASRVRIDLIAQGQSLELRVADNGIGFDTCAQSAPGHGAGLRSMRNRVTRLGGKLDILRENGLTILLIRV